MIDRDSSSAVLRRYSSGADDLLAKVQAILDTLPDDPAGAAGFAGIDQFHVGGLAATKMLAELTQVDASLRVLDAGSGLGGPSRYLADVYGCSVLGVDLTPAFVRVANYLAERAGLERLVRYEGGSVLALDVPSAHFDLIWTQHVAMNIEDRDALYAEFRRVLAPAGRLAFYDVLATDGKREPYFPVPWAERGDTSFLLTETETRAALNRAGFALREWHDVTADMARVLAEGAPPPIQLRGLAAIMGPRFAEMAANAARSFREGRIRLVMGVCATDD